jgi:predicted O-linked N-acetylglucosamine transferase (SPINDLY family)
MNSLVALLGQGRYTEAEVQSGAMTASYPQHGLGWRMLGTALILQGRGSEALGAMRKAADLSPSPEAYYNLAVLLGELGLFYDAEISYRGALRLNPNYAEAHCNLGSIFNEQSRFADAEASCRQALLIRPDFAEAHYNLGVVFNAQGRLFDAESSYRLALKSNPAYVQAHYNLGVVFGKQARWVEAESSYQQALKIKPDFAEAHCNLGDTFKELGRLAEAESSYRRALQIKPDMTDAQNNLGNALGLQGRLTEAEACYRQALSIKPDFTEASYNLGVSLKDQGRLGEAEACYRKALEIDPDYPGGHYNLGVILDEQGRFPEAEASYRQALVVKPDFADAHYNLGALLSRQGRFFEAEACCRSAIEFRPDFIDAHYNLGVALNEQGRPAEAEASYRRALEIKPDFAKAHSNLLFILNYVDGHSSDYRLEAAREYGRMVGNKVESKFSSWLCELRPRRLRIGMVSGDLWDHPVGFFLEALLANVDADRIELIAYPTHDREDEVTGRLRSHFAAWKPLFDQSDEAAARLIHEDRVHILLDLSGHTAHNRLPIFAWKPAPVQCSWLGYFATTGVAQMDYLLGDPYVTPAVDDEHFTETVWRLPERFACFTAPDFALDVGPLPALSTGYITFGCFNNLTKVTDAVMDLWSEVIQAVPGSRLFLKTKQLDDPIACENTRQRFVARGIASDQLILEGSAPRAAYLAAYHRVDIALDPFPYTGGTVSVEGLWMGVPFITRHGQRFVSHMGESIAHNAGLADWIVANDEDYVAKAVACAANQEKLAALRASLRERVVASSLFDATRFARNFEEAMYGMWAAWRDEQA